MKQNKKQITKIIKTYNCKQVGDINSTRWEVDVELLFDFIDISNFNKELLKKLYKNDTF